MSKNELVSEIRLEELKKQIDDLQFSKENLERYTNSLLDELKNLKNKVEIGSLNFNSIRGDIKSKTQRLEDQNRLQELVNILSRLLANVFTTN
ncbi:paramyosin-like isoform X8 [Brachionus plicatilis]|uniref:Paramyosin-like isoform X8 n=1 Tax=Brachionus plicatilis TaxID=10195 RepID=A0A3M7RQN9_BRAPC|nr:paramyosin-like isoform X8 [Brachionus plicatilis]